MTIKATNDLMFKKLLASEESTLRSIERDIAVELRGLNIMVEVQVHYDKHFIPRTLHYAFKRFNSNYGVPGKMEGKRGSKSESYSSLMPVYSINIVEEKLFPKDEDVMRTFTLYDKEHKSGFDREWLKVSYVELEKANLSNENLKHWVEFFRSGKTLDDAPRYLKKAEEVVAFVNLSKEERRMLMAMEKNIAIQESELSSALDTGFDLGVERGIDALAELIMQGVPLDEAVERAKGTVETVQPSEDTD